MRNIILSLNIINVLLVLFIASIFAIKHKPQDFNNEYINKYVNVLDNLRNIKIELKDKISISIEHIDNEISKQLLSGIINKDVKETIETKKEKIDPNLGFHGNDVFIEKFTKNNGNNIQLYTLPNELNELTITPNSKIEVSENEYNGFYKIKIYNKVLFINKNDIE